MKIRKVLVFISFFNLVLAIFFIGVGVYLYTLSKPQHIIGIAIDSIRQNFEDYFLDFDEIDLGDNFSITGSVEFHLDSEYYYHHFMGDVENKNTYNLLNNLNKMDTRFSIQQNKKNRSALVSLQEKIGEEKLVDASLLIDNATEYYYVDSITSHYVNNGNCNYFENLDEENSLKDQLNYLYSFFFHSVKKNLKDEYFTQNMVSQNIHGENQEVRSITIRFTDKLIHTILKDTLEDVKKDEKAFSLLKNSFSSFSDFEIDDNLVFLSKDESYTLTIYTSKVLYKPLKYELIHLVGDEKETFIYEEGENSADIFYLKNDKILYQATMEISSKLILFQIKNSKDIYVGEFRIEREKPGFTIHFSLDDSSMKYDLLYSSKYSNLKKNKSYTNDKSLSLKIIQDKESVLNGEVIISVLASDSPIIQEDISSQTLASSLTEEEKELLSKKFQTVFERLESAIYE